MEPVIHPDGGSGTAVQLECNDGSSQRQRIHASSRDVVPWKILPDADRDKHADKLLGIKIYRLPGCDRPDD